MDDLQYDIMSLRGPFPQRSFKPCYKWMTFNTLDREERLFNDNL